MRLEDITPISIQMRAKYIFNQVGFIDLFKFSLTAVIFIEVLEGSINMFFSVQSVHVLSCKSKNFVLCNQGRESAFWQK